MTSPKDVAVETDLAVRRLLARYCHLVDDRDFDAAAALFSEDARFRVRDHDFTGPEAIRAWMQTIPESLLHEVTNVVVSNGSHPGTAHAVSDLIVSSKSDAGWSVLTVGRYHDSFTGSGREMRFSQRIVTAR
jgi:3-phenylpropionate/cinnamic acid dioxygenase small subunit